MKNILKITISTVLLSANFSQQAFAQVNWSCRKVYSNEAIEKARPFISINQLRPTEIKQIESKITELESKMKERSYKRSSLEREANGDISIPYFLKPEKLKEITKKQREEIEGLEREQKQLPNLKEDLGKALKYLANKTGKTEQNEGGNFGFLDSFGLIGRKRFEKKWTQDDVDSLTHRISIFEKNVPIRNSNIEFYQAQINEIEAPLKIEGIKKAKIDLDELNKKDEPIIREIAELKAKKAQHLEKVRTEAVVLLNKALDDSRLVSPIVDLMSYYSLKNLPTANKVTLLVGNNLTGSTRVEYNQTMQIKALVEGLIQNHFYVVFDAESSYAPYISQLAGDYGVPVMSRMQQKFSDHKNKVIVSNDYLRMKILSDSQAVIATPDSVTGIGLYTEGLVTHMLDTKGTFEIESLQGWTNDLDMRNRNLGVTTKSVKILRNAQVLFAKPENEFSYNSKSVSKPVENFIKFSSLSPEKLSIDSIERVINEATSFAKVMEQNHESGGSVIFGSSKEDKHSANLIYQSAYKLGQLGIAVVTGGAGGAMEIANSGAWNSGGVSIGIPIGGKHMLDTEKTFNSSKHTKTIVTSGYEERIPALLGEGVDSRKLIIFAPGGNGTIKELAVTLVRASGKFTSFKKIVFLDSDYYGPLVNWLRSSSLPQVLKDKIVVIDKADDLETLAAQMQEGYEKARVQKPRNDQLTYSVKTYPTYMPDDSGFKNGRTGRSSYNSSFGTEKNKSNNDVPKKFKDSTDEEQYYRDLYGNFYE